MERILFGLTLFIIVSTSYGNFDIATISKVIGGTEAEAHTAPFIVSIQTIDGIHFCGGAIISQDHVLTAAHCLIKEPSSFVVIAGRHNIKLEEKYSQQRTVLNYKNHESYSGGTKSFDIGIIKVTQPFIFNQFVKSIKVSQKQEFDSGYATLFGWGSSLSTSRPNELQIVQLPLLTFSQCQRANFQTLNIDRSMICTGPLVGGRGGCLGDSGGPLVQQNDGTYDLIGIVSWGFVPCGRPYNPTYYTNVPKFSTWIENTSRRI